MAYGKYGLFNEGIDMKSICFFLAFVLILTVFAIQAVAAGPWKGKIIDIETKEPLEGAVVLAVWERVYRTPAGPNSYFYEAKEVLTDKEGGFEIPSYSPINLLPIISYLRGPHFTVFKPGYLSLSDVDFGDFFLSGTKEAPMELKEMSGKVFRLAPRIIELPKLKTKEERLRVIGSLPPSIPDQAMPNLIKLMNVEEINLGLQPTHVGGKSR